jgi:hypothetical protein
MRRSRVLDRVFKASDQRWALIPLNTGKNRYFFVLVDAYMFSMHLMEYDLPPLVNMMDEYCVGMISASLIQSTDYPCIPYTYQVQASGINPNYRGYGWGRVLYMGLLAVLYVKDMGLTSDRSSTRQEAGRAYEAIKKDNLVDYRHTPPSEHYPQGNAYFDYTDMTPGDPFDDCFSSKGQYDLRQSIKLKPEVYAAVRSEFAALFMQGEELLSELDSLYLSMEVAANFYGVAQAIFDAAYDGGDLDLSYAEAEVRNAVHDLYPGSPFDSITLS